LTEAAAAQTEALAESARRRIPSPGRLVRLWPRVRPYRGILLLATFALLGSSAIGLAFPMVVKYLLDAAFVNHDRALLDRIALGLVLLFTVQAALNYAQAYLLSVAGERAVAGLRRDLFARLIQMPPGFFAERRTGELTSRLTVDVGLLQGVLSHQVSEISRQILSLVGGVVLLTYLQPRLTLTALAVAPLVVGSALVFGKRLRNITIGVQDRVAEATAVAEEAFVQIRTVQSFVQEPAERARYAERVMASVRIALQRARVRGVFFGVLTFSTFVGIVVVLWQGGLLVLDGKLTAGALVSFLLYTVTIAASIGALASSFSAYQEAVGAAERVFEILEMRPEIADPPHPETLTTPVAGRVEFANVSFRYLQGEETWTLEDVTLRVAPGQVIALVGPSGGGKTTLVSLLPRFWDVDRGSIRLDGHDVRALRLADLRTAIGIVPQEPALFSGSVRENIAYARPGASAAEVEAAARAAHAHEFIERLPQGYDTTVGERGVKLSGGQRQRVAIARAILKDPAVLVLDEATSNLDTESERLIEDALEKLLVGRTTLIIAHRLSTVRRADRLVVVDRGRIVEEGTHAELLARGGLYARLYQRQFREDDFEMESLREIAPS
jgi:subfamily B ATP-binding cassette protein MsbA